MSSTFVDRNIRLGFQLARDIVDDPSLLDEIPEGATVVLIPDDDAELAEANLRQGIAAFRAGANVYLRHVRATTAREG